MAAGLNVHGDTCQAALFFKTICSHFLFPAFSRGLQWFSQVGAGYRKFQTRGAGQASGVGPGPKGLEVLGKLRWVKQTFYDLIFASFKKNFYNFALDFDILGCIHFHFEGSE